MPRRQRRTIVDKLGYSFIWLLIYVTVVYIALKLTGHWG